ncbi:carboxylating nicotinate-nucleotide diphosphorylase [Aquisalimonas asiatica]|uniref:Probable nicotinate-nucleotide pyrophosphorylase [carboxylating] n=1 Tax=Aquisalimonas asiatica TaxID=406100 RepID=A0A1H8STF7_9GAMM|nr:carboxylating nicotinate-nucleotide diphosphorylase [Aquisalimonas asiatica]SEO81877.1 nicotinate-nucleotide pyrophosphorylase [carboxylating] [Aquisalimonas asiatica]
MTTPDTLQDDVRRALAEDVGDGDLTAALIPADRVGEATVISREAAVVCGRAWFDAVYRQLDPAVTIHWHVDDGDTVAPDTLLCELSGPARSLVTGERTALNFLQLLSGTATTAHAYAAAVAGTGTRILDTRKTIPGLRQAQKYAVACGGCTNHRVGLFDAILIKENHIMAAGGITAAVRESRRLAPAVTVEVEVESLDELREALDVGADIVLLDNFSLADLRHARELTGERARLEASGNVDEHGLRAIAETGVDYISVGAITKHVQAVDLSMRFRAV